MAFQCRGCYNDKDWFDTGSFKSKGPCETCHYTDICIDAPFNTDPRWKENLIHDLTQAGLPQPDWLAKYGIEYP